ncbi:PREDICTED: epididymal-specific lipocalin-6 [Bison bison bison]|uniref:Epididymal-specific lipocalin-6 n=1 Tax=Bison bison bison TaxID=43346 RepID=A0A6P3IZQ6_BISBB|nr:PREDICTED: epididymal-specific lipocalin-6 [Bison bison bison]
MRAALLAALLAVVLVPSARAVWLGRLDPQQLMGSWYVLAVASGEKDFALEKATKSVEGVEVMLTSQNTLKMRASRHRGALGGTHAFSSEAGTASDRPLRPGPWAAWQRLRSAGEAASLFKALLSSRSSGLAPCCVEACVSEDLDHTGAEGAGPGLAAGRTLTAGPEDGQEGASFCDLRLERCHLQAVELRRQNSRWVFGNPSALGLPPELRPQAPVCGVSPSQQGGAAPPQLQGCSAGDWEVLGASQSRPSSYGVWGGRTPLASQEALGRFAKWSRSLGLLSQQQAELQRDCECPRMLGRRLPA